MIKINKGDNMSKSKTTETKTKKTPKARRVEYLLDFEPRLSSFVRVDITNQSDDTKQYIMDSMTMMDYSGKSNVKRVKIVDISNRIPVSPYIIV
jgi:hypothetical protein